MLNVQGIIEKRYPNFFKRSRLMTKPVMAILKGLFHEKDMQRFNNAFPDCEDLVFVEQVLKYFGFSVQAQDQNNIPKQGRVILVANHPLGALDILALLKMVSEVRQDVKVLSNPILMSMPALKTVIYRSKKNLLKLQFSFQRFANT